MKKILILFSALFIGVAAGYSQPILKSIDEPTEFRLTYELNGGENDPSNKNKYAENSVVKLNKPTKKGYEFKGWYWDKDFKSIVEDSTFSGKKKDLKVYARWDLCAVDLSGYETNMVTIIPEGKKVEIVDFAGTEGTQVIYAYSISKYEVTQDLYTTIMGENPSKFYGSNLPVENVSWYDAIYFCNKLSERCGLEPVYQVDGNTAVSKWNYAPHQRHAIMGKIEQDTSKNGYRLPTKEEWELAARGGLEGGWDCEYSGSDDINEVAWNSNNSSDKTHKVGKRKPNAAGLYDMNGNVSEWVWDRLSGEGDYRYYRGGSFYYDEDYCKVTSENSHYARGQRTYLGFRVVLSNVQE